MCRKMDRIFALVLVIDLAVLLAWELLRETDRGRSAAGGSQTPPETRVRSAWGPPSTPSPTRIPREREAEFLDRIGGLTYLTPAEKGKVREIASHGDPELEMLALEILTRHPDQHQFVLTWLQQQDRKILELVRSHLGPDAQQVPAQLERLLSDLTSTPLYSSPAPSEGIEAPSAFLVPQEGPGPPGTQAGPGSSPPAAPALPEPPEPGKPEPDSDEEVIPEFAQPHDLFLALQNLAAATDEHRGERAASLIRSGLEAEDPFLRGAAVMALNRFPQPDGAGMIRGMLADPVDYVRGCAVNALCEMLRERAIPEMNRLLQEESSDEVLEVILINLARIPHLDTLAVLDQNLDRLPETLVPTARRLRKVLARHRHGDSRNRR